MLYLCARKGLVNRGMKRWHCIGFWLTGCIVTACSLVACTPCSSGGAQAVVAQADSLWAAGKMYGIDEGDSLAMAQAYQTLGKKSRFSMVNPQYANVYAHACYHYGKLLRAQDDPVAAMQVFIRATHTRTNDYHILGRVYSNMGDLCHWAGEFPLAYDMFERSGEMFLRNGDTLLYYYDLNNMAFELAEQGRKEETLHLIRQIMATCTDMNILDKTQETQARLYLNCGLYDSTLYYAQPLFSFDTTYSVAALLIAQAYSFMNIKDSATHYANIVLSHTHELFEINNALYILTNDDESRDKESIREVAADRSDTQKLIENQKGELSQAVQLLELDLNRKPDMRWIYSIIATLIIMGTGIVIYVLNKHKKQELLTQKIEELRTETSSIQEQNDELKEQFRTNQKHIEEDVNKKCSMLRTNESIRKTLAWKNYEKMCSIIDQRFYFLALKLRERYSLNETEVRLCILTLLNCEYDRIAELLYRSKSSIGTLKIRVAKKLGTTAKDMRQYLIENVCVR